MYIDLHTHSNVSDGSLSPTDLINLAVYNNLSLIALTDHDSLDGIAEAKEAARKSTNNNKPITLVSGVEISVYYKNRDIHVLGLLVDENDKVLNDDLNGANQKRKARNEIMAEKFRQAGIAITIDALRERANVGGSLAPDTDVVITRAHFATYLVEHGHAKNTQDAFDKFLGEDSPFYVSREYLAPEKGFDLIHGAKGLAFIAHPFLYDFSNDEIEEMIKDFKNLGLDGVEVYHSTHTKEQEEILLKLASDYDLLITGGTDFHGEVKPDVKIGTGKGNMKIPYSIYEDIKKKKEEMF